MNAPPTTQEIDDAMRAIGAAMPHDPIDNWLLPYKTLRRAMRAIDRAYRPAAAAQVAALVVSVAVVFTNGLDWNPIAIMACLMLFPSLVGMIARYFTARARPFVKRRGAIEEATWPFNYRASIELEAGAA